MIIKRIEGFTKVFGAPPDWNGEDMTCGALPVREVQTPEGIFHVSAWEPTPAELRAIADGETIKLWIRGPGHPVVAMTVGDIT
jgi:hypothetical protein